MTVGITGQEGIAEIEMAWRLHYLDLPIGPLSIMFVDNRIAFHGNGQFASTASYCRSWFGSVL